MKASIGHLRGLPAKAWCRSRIGITLLGNVLRSLAGSKRKGGRTVSYVRSSTYVVVLTWRARRQECLRHFFGARSGRAEARPFGLPADDQDFCDGGEQLFQVHAMVQRPFKGVLRAIPRESTGFGQRF
jgi:hypothetical protein